MKEIAGYSTDDHDLIMMDGYDDCIVGVVERCGYPPLVCYDREKVISKLAKDMSREDAEAWHYFNQARACWGEFAPMFLDYV